MLQRTCSLYLLLLSHLELNYSQAKRGRRAKPPRTCQSCYTSTSSQWRSGRSKSDVLCNRCGIAYRRAHQLGRTFRPVHDQDPTRLFTSISVSRDDECSGSTSTVSSDMARELCAAANSAVSPAVKDRMSATLPSFSTLCLSTGIPLRD
jgi:GATA zinc finger